ncbi:MAG: hypothetical protein WBM07_15245 [Chitinivibrionales bacterium]
MSKFNKIAIALAMVTVLAGPSMAGEVICGGSVPLVNSIIGIGVTSLDFSSAGAAIEIADFFINNNSSGFVITWTFQNGGFFVLGGSGAANASVPMTTVHFAYGPGGGAGTWGTATTAPTLPADITPAAQGTALPVTTTSAGQSTATVNQEVIIDGTWAAAAATAMAGFYTETITFNIAATL